VCIMRHVILEHFNKLPKGLPCFYKRSVILYSVEFRNRMHESREIMQEASRFNNFAEFIEPISPLPSLGFAKVAFHSDI
jgi:hypothetical protein